jgi:hypothetical protein
MLFVLLVKTLVQRADAKERCYEQNPLSGSWRSRDPRGWRNLAKSSVTLRFAEEYLHRVCAGPYGGAFSHLQLQRRTAIGNGALDRISICAADKRRPTR